MTFSTQKAVEYYDGSTPPHCCQMRERSEVRARECRISHEIINPRWTSERPASQPPHPLCSALAHSLTQPPSLYLAFISPFLSLRRLDIKYWLHTAARQMQLLFCCARERLLGQQRARQLAELISCAALHYNTGANNTLCCECDARRVAPSRAQSPLLILCVILIIKFNARGIRIVKFSQHIYVCCDFGGRGDRGVGLDSWSKQKLLGSDLLNE